MLGKGFDRGQEKKKKKTEMAQWPTKDESMEPGKVPK